MDNSNNSIIGHSSTITGSNNHIFGSSAGTNLTGDDNVSIGINSSENASSSSNNVAIGRFAFRHFTTSCNDNVAIGYGSMIGSSGNSVDASNNTCIGKYSGQIITTGYNNVIIGANAGDAITTGSKNIIIGTDADISGANGTNQIVIGDGAVGYGDNIAVLGNSSCNEWIPGADNHTNIGHLSRRFKDVYATNGTIQTSDIREKTDVRDVKLGLDFINALRPVSYKWKDSKTTTKKYGLIAQEVETVLQQFGINDEKEIINYDKDADRYGLAYTELIAPLISSLKELSEENKNLKKYINDLDEKVNTLIDSKKS